MTPQPKIKQESQVPVPVTLVKLRDHFKEKYKLTESQVEIMVVSSSKSLQQGLDQLSRALSSGSDSVEQLSGVYHGLKGLLLNMGELEWAGYTKEIEQKLLAGEEFDHQVIAGVLQRGVEEVLAYCGTNEVCRRTEEC